MCDKRGGQGTWPRPAWQRVHMRVANVWPSVWCAHMRSTSAESCSSRLGARAWRGVGGTAELRAGTETSPDLLACEHPACLPHAAHSLQLARQSLLLRALAQVVWVEMGRIEPRRLCARLRRHRGHAGHAIHARHLLQGWVLHCRVPTAAPHVRARSERAPQRESGRFGGGGDTCARRSRGVRRALARRARGAHMALSRALS